MQVKLTEKGRKSLGLSADKRVVSVSDDRAFAMMLAGMANEDYQWMKAYKANNLNAGKAVEKAVKKAPETTEAKEPERAVEKPPEKAKSRKEKQHNEI